MTSGIMAIRLALLAALGAAATARAETAEDRYWFRAGAQLAKADTHVRISATEADLGTEISFETMLGLPDRRLLPSFSAGMRLGGNWRLTGDIFTLSREGERSIAGDIVVDDVTYPAGARLKSGFRSTTYRVAAGYSFLRGEDHEIGAALGLHLTDFALFIEGEGNIGAETAAFERRQRDLLAPLPTLGLYAGWSPAPNLTLGVRLDYLRLKISDYTGKLVNAEGGLTWRVHRNIGIGAQYRHIDYRLDVDKTHWRGAVGYRFSGPMLFTEIAF